MDLIVRQAAIQWVKTECNPYGNPTLDFESGKKVIEHLEHMPPIAAEPVRRGRWVHVNPMVDTLMCSVCGYNILSEELISNFCPDCGAKMED